MAPNTTRQELAKKMASIFDNKNYQNQSNRSDHSEDYAGYSGNTPKEQTFIPNVQVNVQILVKMLNEKNHIISELNKKIQTLEQNQHVPQVAINFKKPDEKEETNLITNSSYINDSYCSSQSGDMDGHIRSVYKLLGRVDQSLGKMN